MVISIELEKSTQVVFAKHDDVVEALATDRADEALRLSALPRRPVHYRSIADLHCREPLPDDVLDPLRRRMRCDRHSDDTSTVMFPGSRMHEKLETDRRHHEQTHRRDPNGVVAEKGLPTLARRGTVPRHVFGDGRLRDLDAELQ